MKLCITAGSPFTRIALIVIIEKGREDRIDIVPAPTRLTSTYLRRAPSWHERKRTPKSDRREPLYWGAVRMPF
jgi:hypothetical protein